MKQLRGHRHLPVVEVISVRQTPTVGHMKQKIVGRRREKRTEGPMMRPYRVASIEVRSSHAARLASSQGLSASAGLR